MAQYDTERLSLLGGLQEQDINDYAMNNPDQNNHVNAMDINQFEYHANDHDYNKIDENHDLYLKTERIGFWLAIMRFDIKQKFKGKQAMYMLLLSFAFLMSFFGSSLLFWNEHSYNKEIQTIENIKIQMVNAPQSPSGANNDKLIFIKGKINLKETMLDPMTKLSLSSPKVTRNVEQYKNGKWIKAYDPLNDFDTANDEAHILSVPLFPFHWNRNLYVGEYQLSPYLQQQVLNNQFFESTTNKILSNTINNNEDVSTKSVQLSTEDINNFKKGFESIENEYAHDIKMAYQLQLDNTYSATVKDMVDSIDISSFVGLGIKIKVNWKQTTMSQAAFGFSKTDCTNDDDTFLFLLSPDSTAMEYIPADNYNSICYGKVTRIHDNTLNKDITKCQCDQQSMSIKIQSPPNAVKWMHPLTGSDVVVNQETMIYFGLQRLPLFDDSNLNLDMVNKYRIGFSQNNCITINTESKLTPIEILNNVPVSMTFSAIFKFQAVTYNAICFSTNGIHWEKQTASIHIIDGSAATPILFTPNIDPNPIISAVTPQITKPGTNINVHGGSSLISANRIGIIDYKSESAQCTSPGSGSFVTAPIQEGEYKFCVDGTIQDDQYLIAPLIVHKKVSSDVNMESLLQNQITDNAFMLNNFENANEKEGRLKVSYDQTVISPDLEVTVIARQELGTDNIARLDRWISDNEENNAVGIEMIQKGIHSFDDFFDLKLMQNEAILWLLRFLTFGMIAGGCYIWCIFLHEIIIELPVINKLKFSSVYVLSLMFGVLCYFILFGLCWTFYHPFWGTLIATLVMIIMCGIQTGMITMSKKEMETALNGYATLEQTDHSGDDAVNYNESDGYEESESF